MDSNTLQALQESIIKWEKNYANPLQAKIGSKDCPLCQMFNAPGEYYECKGCPINDVTNNGCCNTPYEEFYYEFTYSPTESKLKILARKELEFLKSLLPKEE